MAVFLRSHYAFARLFTEKPSYTLKKALDFGINSFPKSHLVTSARVYERFSPLVAERKEQYEYEVIKNPPEWEYVQRLLPHEHIPKVIPKAEYPSGWTPPREEARDLPYFIARSRNHMIPIYLQITHRGTRKITKVKRIDGDIWMLNNEIKKVLQQEARRYVETSVNEFGRFIEVKGDFVNILKDWAHSKGF